MHWSSFMELASPDSTYSLTPSLSLLLKAVNILGPCDNPRTKQNICSMFSHKQQQKPHEVLISEVCLHPKCTLDATSNMLQIT